MQHGVVREDASVRRGAHQQQVDPGRVHPIAASRYCRVESRRQPLIRGGAMKTVNLLMALSLAGVSAAIQAQAPLKIGFIAELSGPQGALGQDQYDAFMLVVEQNGGKLGGVPVQVLREDSQLKPEVATQIVDKLIEKDKVPIITGITFSNVMMAVHKKITEKEVFLIGSNAGPAPIAGAQCSPYAFITSWQNDNQAEVVGKYATDKGYKRVVGMAPNYQAGKDFIAGFKRFYKGEVIDEIYTPLNQPDFSAELAQVTAKNPDAVYVFYPGGLGVNFIRQYKQAGLAGRVPLLSTSTADGSTLPAQKDDALGVISGTFWGPDFNNPASRKFVDEFEKKFNRIPSQYAAQSYDAALLLDSAIGKVKGNVADKKAFMAALKAADFKSVRGDFKFGNNNFPVQDMHVFEVAKDAKGRVSLKTIGTPMKAHQDAYAAQCALK
jgi:branched-chain amino acid transport system substrate-binding protein